MSETITVVGSLNMDLVVLSPRIPKPGETIIGFEWHTIPGGKGANQAVAANWCAFANRNSTASQFTTFHQALI